MTDISTHQPPSVPARITFGSLWRDRDPRRPRVVQVRALNDRHAHVRTVPYPGTPTAVVGMVRKISLARLRQRFIPITD
jgi:hypothetical protein